MSEMIFYEEKSSSGTCQCQLRLIMKKSYSQKIMKLRGGVKPSGQCKCQVDQVETTSFAAYPMPKLVLVDREHNFLRIDVSDDWAFQMILDPHKLDDEKIWQSFKSMLLGMLCT
jgi:hypothetical protein